jgi:hypothetical protein
MTWTKRANYLRPSGTKGQRSVRPRVILHHLYVVEAEGDVLQTRSKLQRTRMSNSELAQGS